MLIRSSHGSHHSLSPGRLFAHLANIAACGECRRGPDGSGIVFGIPHCNEILLDIGGRYAAGCIIVRRFPCVVEFIQHWTNYRRPLDLHRMPFGHRRASQRAPAGGLLLLRSLRVHAPHVRVVANSGPCIRWLNCGRARCAMVRSCFRSGRREPNVEIHAAFVRRIRVPSPA